MLEKKRVSFRPMNEDDLVLMLKWLTDDRVLEFYDGRDKKHTQKTIREHYTEQWADEIYRVIIEYDTIPIGYAQIYRIQGELFDEYNYHETEEKIYAMDQFIGEPEYWNMGIGAEYCRVVCQYLRHPASTTHAELNEAEQAEQGIKPNTIRLSIGTENIDDILYDLQEAFDAVK